MLTQFSFPKKGERIKSKFPIVNLCNGGTKDFVELWEIINLKTWTRFSIRQTKLLWINLKNYNQTCSNNHLCKMTTCLRQQMPSLPKQSPIQSLLYKMTTCLTWPVTNFLVSQMKKTCLKQPLKTLSREEMQNKHMEQCIKNKPLSDYIYSIATL